MSLMSCELLRNRHTSLFSIPAEPRIVGSAHFLWEELKCLFQGHAAGWHSTVLNHPPSSRALFTGPWCSQFSSLCHLASEGGSHWAFPL